MDADDALEIVSFMAGGYRFAVEACQIGRMFDIAPEIDVAVEALLGLPPAEATHRCWLRVGDRCVAVGTPVALRSLPVSVIYPLPELVLARLQLKGIRAVALEAGSSMLLVDLRGALAQISA